jgi:hypothetical protein
LANIGSRYPKPEQQQWISFERGTGVEHLVPSAEQLECSPDSVTMNKLAVWQQKLLITTQLTKYSD